MKNALKTLTLVIVMAMPMGAFAADTKTTNTPPPQDTPVYPCWDIMQNGHMTHMRGMWSGNQQGHMMMMPQQNVQQMQQEIEDLRKQVEELKKK